MPGYTPPIYDMTLLLDKVLSMTSLGRDDLDTEIVHSILEEAGKLATTVLAPLNESGDREGAVFAGGTVKTAKNFREAYQQYQQGGWNSVPFPTDFGGQGLPWVVSFPIQEMWQSSNMSFGLCPLLNQGAVEALLHHGAKDLQDYYLPKLISGEWTGTMNLTEPHAGSDLALLRTKAERADDGTYRIFGQKIFITYGDHDLTDNIIHLVLARLPDAPEGVKGISLFLVPKFLKDGTRNDVTCVSIEHKLGIHASPTCTMQFGDKDGAVGYLVGQENEGLRSMFTMMNNARLSVGLQGVAVSERALQAAKAYAVERKQGKPLSGGDTVTIDKHPDIERMILTMESLTLAGRGLAYEAAIFLDKAKMNDPASQRRVDLMTPVVKAWCTDNAVEVASLGVQVHGGMGFIEETGVAQYYRDARILPIYEGTNGIQANDLVFRKVIKDDGSALSSWIQDMKRSAASSATVTGIEVLEKAMNSILKKAGVPDDAAWVAVPFLNLVGYVAAGVMLERIAEKDVTKTRISGFYNRHLLPRIYGLLRMIEGEEFVGRE
ncbi:MAG: acyl-CoA dehydrogenase [Alphaproteobacteria bacterium]|nr:acyl-CoA dehydrogenase [Alphaproteobacteria bacterium]